MADLAASGRTVLLMEQPGCHPDAATANRFEDLKPTKSLLYWGSGKFDQPREVNMANITRVDPFDDLFRGFFVRPVDFNSAQNQAPSIKMYVKEEDDSYLVHAELPGVKKRISTLSSMAIKSRSAPKPSRKRKSRKGIESFAPNAISARYPAPSSSSGISTTARPPPNSMMASLN